MKLKGQKGFHEIRHGRSAAVRVAFGAHRTAVSITDRSRVRRGARKTHTGVPRLGGVNDRYGSDVLASNPHGLKRTRSTEQVAKMGLVVEDAQTGYVGAIVAVEYGRMQLEDRNGRRKSFPIGPGYLIDGKPVIINPPMRRAHTAPTRTASGSVAVTGGRAKVALASRIYVEG